MAVAPPPPTGLIEPRVEALIGATGIDFRIGGNRAFYMPSLDYVQVPPPQAYFEPINWHRTSLHELGHASGHHTLSVQAKGVRIVPDLRATGENAPSHRVLVGRAEIGAAWSKRSNEGRDYLGLKLDDPSFNAPIYANLFDDEEGDTFSLIWSRPNGRRGD